MRTQSADTTPEAEAVLVAGLRRFSPARRLQMAAALTRMTRQLSWTGLCRRYPTASEEELRYRWGVLLYGEALATPYIAAWRARHAPPPTRAE
jgi:hypothetical protein